MRCAHPVQGTDKNVFGHMTTKSAAITLRSVSRHGTGRQFHRHEHVRAAGGLVGMWTGLDARRHPAQHLVP